MRNEAEKRIGQLYPKIKITVEMTKDRQDLKPYIGKELTVIAWIWTRTVASPNPAVHGVYIPLVRSFWLSGKTGKERWVEPILDRDKNQYRFEVRTGMPPATFDPKKGTVNRSGARCILSDSLIPFEYIRSEGKSGRTSSKLMAIVVEGDHGRVYLSPNDEQEKIAFQARPQNYPDTNLPEQALVCGFNFMEWTNILNCFLLDNLLR